VNLLALDSSTEACSVALMAGGELRSRHEIAPRKHAELILPFMDQLLAEAGIGLRQVDALAFGRGPGAFTGIRIATGVVQGIAFAVDLPVVPVSTLATIAQGALREQGARRVIAAIDARMGEVYWCGFEADAEARMRPVAEECVVGPGEAPMVAGDGWHGSGSGWSSYDTVLSERYRGQLASLDGQRLPNAVDVATLAEQMFLAGHGVSAEQALPVYLRDKVAEKKG
jgi:tRNA threonylcarbamoyladenosine biosynthesis protein TsaB